MISIAIKEGMKRAVSNISTSEYESLETLAKLELRSVSSYIRQLIVNDIEKNKDKLKNEK
ncbi:hypothetical protein CNY62_00980 [Brochothrix thermosphacta]|uniref:Ribbon-helix-helix protein CopG domain-containing protein n=1 Tax=Brochothrix thermosphacta TaxID=2756 RepID=A0A291BUX4_BROTH|nr:hypothetical protein [Brochothrix thermosphacta]ATF25065.1 hypothetical protein CNY62_00980 [Brochothrix thermosphacta]